MTSTTTTNTNKEKTEAEVPASTEISTAMESNTTAERTVEHSHTSSISPEPKPIPNDSTSTSMEESTESMPNTSAPAPTAAKGSVNPEDTRTKLETFVIMASLCASVFLAALDTTIITTALPTISEYFHSSAGYTWIGSAYLLASAASTPSWGKFSDIWGRKPILLVAVGIFFVGSLLCAVSVNIGMLIAARAIQGIGGGGLIVLVNICIGDLFSMRNRGAYFGIIGMVWAFASATGPILGGVFTEKVSWRWCFYMNLPITGTVFFALLFFLKIHNPRTPVWDGLKAVDWLGSFAIAGGTLMLLLGLEFGGVTRPWGSATVICLTVFGLVVAALFVINEWKFARYPITPLRLFNERSNVCALVVCFCHGYVFIAGSYYLPLYFQAVLGATPLLSGVYLLPFALALSVTAAGTGIFMKKTGKYKPAIFFGLFLMTLGFGLYIDLPLTPGWAQIIIFQIIAGIGVGPNFQSPLIALQSMVKPQDIATATATFGFIRNLSTSISVVIGSVVFQNQMQKKTASLAQSVGIQTASSLSGGSAGASVGLVNALPAAQKQLARMAYHDSLKIMWIMYVCFAGLGLLVTFGIKTNTLSKEHTTIKTGIAEEEKKRRERKEELRASKDLARKEQNGDLVGKEEV